MFEIAIFIGLYSYVLFFLGVFGLLYKQNVIFVTLLYLLTIILLYYKKISLRFKLNKLDKLSKFIIALLAFQLLINLVGVLGPELSFDALWYHLTLPKIFLQNHLIFHIPGNLLYYSDMPKLTEMLYVFGFSIGNEIFAKLIHFSFGILVLVAIYKISRKFTSEKLSLLASLIFYSNLVVGWESITAYVDLSLTFFEVMGFWAFLNWFETKNIKWIFVLGLMIGFSISVKLVSVGSIIIYACLFFASYFLKYKYKLQLIKVFSLFVLISILIPLSWFIFAFLNTGNPFYPYFTTQLADSGKTLILPNFKYILTDLYNFFLRLNDPISPIYLIILPLIIVEFKKFKPTIRYVAIYSFLAFLIWYLTEEQRGGRFIMPYLPVFSILCVISLEKLKSGWLKKYLIFMILVVSVISIGYRGIANAKFAPIILGRETKSRFLSNHLNFSFGDFYDTDNYFKTHIKPSDKVLLIGFHNLYYVDFPFIDYSWVKKGDEFDYIAVQNSNLPKRFSSWRLIYYNKLTKVKLYSMKEVKCVY